MWPRKGWLPPGQVIKFPGATEHLARGEHRAVPALARINANVVLQLVGARERAHPASDH